MSDPDLSAGAVIFRHRDEALDQAWGEGVEVTLTRLPDGRVYQQKMRVHIDADGPQHDDRFLPDQEAISLLASYGQSGAAARLFPGTEEARWFARFGSCDRHALDPVKILAVAERAWSTGDLVVHTAGDGLWLVERDGRRALTRPDDALRALLERGCPTDTLARWFADAPPVRLLRRLGAASWPAAAAQLAELVQAAAPPVHAWREGDRALRLVRLGPGESSLASLVTSAPAPRDSEGPSLPAASEPPRDAHFVLEETGPKGARHTALGPLEAAPLLNGLVQRGAPRAVLARAFPEPGALEAALRECQRRAGISFPG